MTSWKRITLGIDKGLYLAWGKLEIAWAADMFTVFPGADSGAFSDSITIGWLGFYVYWGSIPIAHD